MMPAGGDVLCRELNVFVRGLRVEAEIGLHAHEKGRSQPLIIDIEVALNPRPIGGIEDTLNYEALVARADALATGGHIELVETFAERLASACLDEPGVLRVRVRVDKPLALEGADAAGVEVVLGPRPGPRLATDRNAA
jgi:dihydroneopterin aldolase